MSEVSIGDSCFSRCRLTVFENLPCLREIGLGNGVFEGADGAKNTLVMKSSSTVHPPSIDLSKLRTFTAGKCSFGYANEVLFESELSSTIII